jgi:hypothetical protein
MSSENIKLKILGVVSNNLINKYKNILCYKNDGSDVLLFCDYSNFDISVGHIFDTIMDLKNGQIFHNKIRLKCVSQEFNLPFDSIPKGHKTICNFQFIDRNAERIILELPHISNWYESERAIEFS